MPKFFVTTPIYYINDKPHVGHAYCTIAADVLARYYRQLGYEVLFSVGVDENAQKTVEAAAKSGAKSIQQYSTTMANIWQKTWDDLGISYDAFIRTTSPAHIQAVNNFIEAVTQRGDIYMGEYEGLYCVGCEEFKRPEELVDGKCLVHNRQSETVKEQNYFFRLSKYQTQLTDYIKANPGFIQPESRRNEVLAFIERGLEDISVSRSGKDWGISWPNDPSQVVYVWFDALINYLTAVGYPGKDYAKTWPADVHIVGKDITKFHCVMWPAMLLSAGVELPRMVFGHGFFTIDGTKISKSLGNAIDPIELTSTFGRDALRYYLLSEIPFGADGNFSHERFESVYISDLANDLGNAVSRTLAMISKYFDGNLAEVSGTLGDEVLYHEAMKNLRFEKALDEVWKIIKGVNQYIDAQKPWVLAKSDIKQLELVLGRVVADLRQVAKLLMPLLPDTSAKMTLALGAHKINNTVGILFPRINEKLE